MKPPKNRVFINRNRKRVVTHNAVTSYGVAGAVKRIKRKDYSEDWFKIIEKVKTRDGFKCVICSSKKDLEVHHIIPLSRGGTNSPTNLITLCETHHNARHKHMRGFTNAKRKKNTHRTKTQQIKKS